MIGIGTYCSHVADRDVLLYRHYRDRHDETPSHTGGVSDAYLQKVKDKRDRDRGVYASSSKDRDKNKETGKKLLVVLCCCC